MCHLSRVSCQLSKTRQFPIHPYSRSDFAFQYLNFFCFVAKINNNGRHFCRQMSFVTCHMPPVHNYILSYSSLFTLWFCFPIAQHVCIVARIKNNVPHFCRHMSCVTCHVSAVTCPQPETFLFILIHALNLLSNISKFSLFLQGLRIMCRIFAAACHVSPFTCHMSAVSCPQLDTFLFIIIHTLILLSNISTKKMFCCKD